MLKLELITERDLVDSASMYSEYQKNSFLLNQLLISDASNITEFCRVLQSMESKQEIGKMLVNGKGLKYYFLFNFLSITAIDSIPADDKVNKQLSSATPTQLTSSEEDDTPVYQPEIFLAAKAVHINFFNLVI